MLNKFSASAKLYMLIFITAGSLIGLGLYGVYELKKMDQNTHSLYADRILPIQELSTVRFEYVVEILPEAQRVKDHIVTFSEAQKQLKEAEKIIDKNWNNYKHTFLTPGEAVLVKQTDVLKNKADKTSDTLAYILTKQDTRALDAFIKKRFSVTSDPFYIKLTELMEIQVGAGKELFDSNNEIYHSTIKKFFFLILIALIIALSLSFYIIQNVKNLINNILKSNNLIKESEEKYHSLFEQASDAIYVINFKGYFTNVNESMCQMVGYSRGELLKMNLAELLNADLLKANPLIYPVVKPGDSLTGERRAVRKDGKIIDVEINGKKFEDDRVLVIVRDITARKEMEAELKKAELTFRTLTDKSMVGIYISQQGKFIYVNPRFAEVFGYTPHEIIGFTDGVEELIHQDYKVIAAEYIRSRLEDGVESVHYEAMGIKKDGSTNWIEFYGSTTVFDGEPTIIGSMVDITERKLAENELRISEQKYKMLFDSSPMPLLMVSKNDLSIIAANKEATNLYGYTNDELLKMTIRDMRHEEDREKIWDNFRANITGSSERGIFRHVKKDGTVINVQVIAHDIVFEGKKVRLGLFNDLTEKIKADEIHQKTEANLQTILNTTDTAYALLDRDLDVLEYNNKAIIFSKNQFNLDLQEGGKIYDHLPEDRRKQFFEYIDNVFKGNTISYEVVYDKPGGGSNWYYVRMFPIANKQNEIIGLMLAITDITERKDAEQSLQLAYDHIQANIKFIREMIWKQSHILRSPLANLKGLIAVLRSDPANEEALHLFEVEFERMDKVFFEMAEESSKNSMNF